MKSIRIIIIGRVQKVNFRQSVKRLCDQVGLVGQVKNLENGSVEIMAIGPEENIQQLITWCNIGPPRAIVEKLIVEEIPTQLFTGFKIVR